ncbi:MAG: hypothetical protein VSS75_008930, partial [Candidatus Parabeggiatoa sp.]|nr:hypothetical protein [Candidatus Parabeggiatoa sp.]
MMITDLRRKRVPTRDTHLGPPNRWWRLKSVCTVTLALLIGSVVSTNSWAQTTIQQGCKIKTTETMLQYQQDKIIASN